jgi:hypothetical protein
MTGSVRVTFTSGTPCRGRCRSRRVGRPRGTGFAGTSPRACKNEYSPDTLDMPPAQRPRRYPGRILARLHGTSIVPPLSVLPVVPQPLGPTWEHGEPSERWLTRGSTTGPGATTSSVVVISNVRLDYAIQAPGRPTRIVAATEQPDMRHGHWPSPSGRWRTDRRLGGRLSRDLRTAGNPDHGRPGRRRGRMFMHGRRGRERPVLHDMRVIFMEILTGLLACPSWRWRPACQPPLL